MLSRKYIINLSFIVFTVKHLRRPMKNHRANVLLLMEQLNTSDHVIPIIFDIYIFFFFQSNTSATQCVNTGSGGFECLDCPPGYTGDGVTCTDIDEVKYFEIYREVKQKCVHEIH